jgi:hypothetical protein
MATQTSIAMKKLTENKLDLNLAQKTSCSADQNRELGELLKNGSNLPDGLFQEVDEYGAKRNEFYWLHCDLNSKEITQYVALEQLKALKSIRICAIFFVTITVISIIITIIATLIAGNSISSILF